MLVEQPQHNDTGEHMLSHPNLIRKSPNGNNSCNNVPKQDSPSCKSILDQRHNLKGIVKELGAHPHSPEVKAMNRRSDKHGPRNPSMQPVEPLMTAPYQESDNVDLCRQKVEQ